MPAWVRASHILNTLFISLLMRSGLPEPGSVDHGFVRSYGAHRTDLHNPACPCIVAAGCKR
ncbi:MAG: hypothetical protein ABI401_03520 [Candidatus Dormibacter sp.]